jgi:hypothetical protein
MYRTLQIIKLGNGFNSPFFGGNEQDWDNVSRIFFLMDKLG